VAHRPYRPSRGIDAALNSCSRSSILVCARKVRKPLLSKGVTSLLHMSYNLVYTPEEMDKTMFRIRDAKDYPVLYTAILEDVDILITGDKDFAAVEIEKPELMTPADFMAKYL